MIELQEQLLEVVNLPHVSVQLAGEKIVQDFEREYDNQYSLHFDLIEIKNKLGAEWDENGFVEEAAHAFKQLLLATIADCKNVYAEEWDEHK